MNQLDVNKVLSFPVDESFDTLHPVEELRDFGKFLRAVTPCYEYNACEIIRYQDGIENLLHIIELSPNFNATEGYCAYKQLREFRRERRKLKNENKVLKPLYDFLKANPQIASQLSQIQGRCNAEANSVSRATYIPRTTVPSFRPVECESLAK